MDFEIELAIRLKLSGGNTPSIPNHWITLDELIYRVFKRILPYRIGASTIPKMCEKLLKNNEKYRLIYCTRGKQNRLVRTEYYNPEVVHKLTYLIKNSYCIYGKNTTKVKLPLKDVELHYIRRLN